MAKASPKETHLSRGAAFVLGAAITALLGIPAGIYVSKRANTAMLVQQERLSEVQAFENTGAQVDMTVSQLSDAIVDEKGSDAARRNLRVAVSAHSSAAFALRDGLGSDYQPYMAKMVELREFADDAETAPEGVKVWQSTADLIAMRKRAADRIKAEATQ